MKIAVLVTCFNRVNVTASSLRSLVNSLVGRDNIDFHIYLIDDGSKDKTGEVILRELPEHVTVKQGTGSLYWTGGMRAAYLLSKEYGDYDYYLLFNDDVHVSRESVDSFLEDLLTLDPKQNPVLVAATTDRDGKNVTYSGFKSTSRWRPRACLRVIPSEQKMTPMDMPNGNFMMVYGQYYDQVGGLDARYVHGHADIDFGMSAVKQGFKVWLARRPIGWCSTNQPLNEKLREMPFRARRTLLATPKFNGRDFYAYCRKHYPTMLFPLYFCVYQLRKMRWLVRP